MFKTIVIATDGSPDSDRAFALASSLAEGASARVVAVHVIELVGGKGGVYPAAANEDDLQTEIAGQVEKLRSSGVQAELVVQKLRLGGPAHAIAEIADSVGADLIVVGTRGRSPVSELILGSVPIRLLQLAHRPVLVVPPPAHS
jgi:nucleotide-binding universal stress UspA family protein